MPKDQQARQLESIDASFVAAVSREVIARLKASVQTSADATIADRIITSQTIESLTGKPSQVFIAKSAVVTPAARDEARRRGIAIKHATDPLDSTLIHDSSIDITDTCNPQRGEGLRNQLSRRGAMRNAARIVLSDQPASEVHRLCAAGERAVMIANVNDVRRFADDFGPTVWVLDMKRMNLTAAVNAAAQIAQQDYRTR